MNKSANQSINHNPQLDDGKEGGNKLTCVRSAVVFIEQPEEDALHVGREGAACRQVDGLFCDRVKGSRCRLAMVAGGQIETGHATKTTS